MAESQLESKAGRASAPAPGPDPQALAGPKPRAGAGGESDASNEPRQVAPAPTEHPLRLALERPYRFVGMVAATLACVLALLFATALGTRHLILDGNVEIPGVIRVRAKANQVIVPASAGWIALNPLEAFEPGTELTLAVSGKVSVAAHHLLHLADWDGPFPPDLPAADAECSVRRNYLKGIGHWSEPWRDPADPSTSNANPDCLLSPHGQIGQLVYAVSAEAPSSESLGVRHLRGIGGVLTSVHGTNIPLPKGGYVLLAVNDRLATPECNPLLYAQADALRDFLAKMDSQCGKRPNGKSYPDLYNLSPDFLESRAIGDNAGQFLVSIR